MASKQFNDLGLGTKAKRLINKDGTFNVKRSGKGISFLNLYQSLIRMPWTWFLLLVMLVLLGVNALFGFIYFAYGVDSFIGIEKGDLAHEYLECLFFSFQTFTTVGYGHIAPIGEAVSLIASFEAMMGLMVFAIITGLLYGRFAKPNAKFLFSHNLLVSPYQDGLSLQFRIINQRKSNIMDLRARMLVSYTEKGKSRVYFPLTLERETVMLFPLNWTIVHPIDEKSPLRNMKKEDLALQDAEFIIVLKGYDDTFSQEVHSIHSYRYDELIWGARFKLMYQSMENGITELQTEKINDFEII